MDIAAIEISDQHRLKIWVKTEVDLDPLEYVTTEHTENNNVHDSNCYDDGSKASSNLCTNLTLNDDRTSECILPDINTNEDEVGKVDVPGKPKENYDARILELETLVNEQKAEIEHLRRKLNKCICRANNIVQKNYQEPVRKRKHKRRNAKSGSVKTTKDSDEQPSVCPVCGKKLKTIKTRYAQIRHLINCRDKPVFKCDKCNRQWTREDKLRAHSKQCKLSKQKTQPCNSN